MSAPTPYRKPLPVLDEESRPFWEGCRSRRLLVQACADCGHRRWPIGPACTACLSPESAWVELTGEGEIWSWIVYHHAFHPEFAADLPYAVALVRLDEGHTMVSTLVTERFDDIRAGQRVRVVFDDVTDEVTIPRFRRITEAGRRAPG